MTIDEKIGVLKSLLSDWASLCMIGVRVNGEAAPGQPGLVYWHLFAPSHFDLWEVPGVKVLQGSFGMERSAIESCPPEQLKEKFRHYFQQAMMSLWETVTEADTVHNLGVLEEADDGKEG